MSYICKGCGRQVERGKRPDKVVTKRRDVTYTTVSERSSSRFDREESLPDRESTGWEIAEEILACSECAERLRKQGPKIVGTVSRTIVRSKPKRKLKEKRNFKSFE